MSSGSATQTSITGASRLWVPASCVVLLCAVLGGVMIGPAGPEWWRVPLELLNRLPLITIDSGLTATDWAIVWNIRAPRVVLAALVGSTLSLAGASYQGVFRNPLVDPYLLGVAAGAGLGATVVITVNRAGSSSWLIDPLPLAAFIGGLVAVLVTYVVGSRVSGERTSTTLVLAGVAVTSLNTALQTFLLQRNSDVLRQVYSWILGRLSSATWSDVRLVLPYVILSTIALLFHRRLLDVLRVGDEEATALGVDVSRVRLVVVIAATLGTAAVVAVSGLIGFVGIIVPHAVRLVVGASYRIVMPMCILVGAAFLILADIPGRVLDNPAETPIGVVTAFLGAPFFLLILRTRQAPR
jgi:iron complex transport system permease protein